MCRQGTGLGFSPRGETGQAPPSSALTQAFRPANTPYQRIAPAHRSTGQAASHIVQPCPLLPMLYSPPATPAATVSRRHPRRPMAGQFADSVVVITGAGTGIGRATALAFG